MSLHDSSGFIQTARQAAGGGTIRFLQIFLGLQLTRKICVQKAGTCKIQIGPSHRAEGLAIQILFSILIVK